MSEQQITLTERAAMHVKSFLEKQDNNLGLRVAVKPTGCSGNQYVIETAQQVHEHDQCFESYGVKLIVDEQSMKYLAGTELDFVKEGLNSSFRFNNPNVTDTCGCGESFTVDEAHSNNKSASNN